MLVSVIIPTYCGRERLDECLAGIVGAAAASGDMAVEVIVVDDASPDGTANWLADTQPGVRVMRMGANVGFAKAANAGIRAARCEWVALLNDDAVPDAGWIAGARLGRRDGDVGAVASRIVRYDDPDVIESAGDGYTTAGLAYHRLNGRSGARAGEAERVFSACAAAAFYRRAAIEEAGLFGESFGSHYEDVDLGFRLTLLGWRTVYEPGSVCRHRCATSYGELSHTRLFNSARNSEVVFFSCMPGRLLVKYFLWHLAALAAQACLRLRQGRLAAFVAGKLEFIGRLPSVLRRRRAIQARRRIDVGQLASLMDGNWVRHVAATKFGKRRGKDGAQK